MKIYDIIRRWHDGQSISHIAGQTGLDRKTVREYIHRAKSKGLSPDDPLPEQKVVLELLNDVVKTRTYTQPTRQLLLPYKNDIIAMINASSHQLRPKSVFEVISIKHELKDRISYSSFKRGKFYSNRTVISAELGQAFQSNSDSISF